jgi:hypothetical protein
MVYQQLGLSSNFPRWLFIAPSNAIKSQVEEYAATLRGPNPSNPFVLHVLLVNIVVATWRRYLIYLAEEIQKQVIHLNSTTALTASEV